MDDQEKEKDPLHLGSEALEHRLEHVILRKQEQVDALERARRAS